MVVNTLADSGQSVRAPRGGPLPPSRLRAQIAASLIAEQVCDAPVCRAALGLLLRAEVSDGAGERRTDETRLRVRVRPPIVLKLLREDSLQGRVFLSYAGLDAKVVAKRQLVAVPVRIGRHEVQVVGTATRTGLAEAAGRQACAATRESPGFPKSGMVLNAIQWPQEERIAGHE